MSEPEYTVFIRVPIPRGDFVDPPPVNWNPSKDEELWKILSGVAKNQINWNELAADFDVTLDFLLRQVAYLTERHNIELRDALRSAAAAAKGSAAPSPVPGAEGAPMGHQRTGSALSTKRDSPLPRTDGSGVGTPINTSLRPNISRNASGNIAVMTHNLGGGSSPRPGKATIRQAEGQTQRRRLSSLPMVSTPRDHDPPSPGPAETSSDESDDSSPAQSRIIRRPPRFQQQDGPSPYGDDDDDAEPAFGLPRRESTDLGATLRGDSRRAAKGRDRIHHSQTSDSSTSSAAMVPRNVKTSGRPPPGPLSPKRAIELAGRSPSGKSKDVSREGSDGTPSMGSSYSDLDDSSVTHSALAEALAAGMQEGAMGSRLSIAQSISRRFVPKKNT